MTFKEFKTYLRKKIGYRVVRGEFVEDAIQFNARSSWDSIFADKKFVKNYASPDRIRFYEEMYAHLASVLEGKEVKTILDMGCGTGHLLQLLSQKNPSASCVGADFTEEGLLLARALLPGAIFVQQDIYDDRQEWHQSFDVVVCTEVLEHLSHPEKAVARLLAYLKKDGVLLLTVPNGRKDTYNGHIHFWSPESWVLFLEPCLGAAYTLRSVVVENGSSNLALICPCR